MACAPKEDSFRIMGIEEYYSDEKESLIHTKQVLQGVYLSKIEAALQASQSSDTDPTEMAREMLFDGVEFFLNADEEIDENYDSANGLRDEFESIEYDRYFLLLSAPKENHKYKMKFEDEVDARGFQFQNFRQKHYGVRQEPTLNPYYEVTCLNYDNMMAEIEDFMMKKASKAKEALIILNGHGCPLGTLLYQDLSPTNLDTVIGDIEKIMQKCKLSSSSLSVPLPHLVQLVLAQCYGHVWESSSNKNTDLKVICFTSDDKPFTTMTVNRHRDPRLKVRVVVDSHHSQLEKFGEDENLKLDPTNKPGPSTGMTGEVSIEGVEDMDTKPSF